jgi:hypothetical protein
VAYYPKVLFFLNVAGSLTRPGATLIDSWGRPIDNLCLLSITNFNVLLERLNANVVIVDSWASMFNFDMLKTILQAGGMAFNRGRGIIDYLPVSTHRTKLLCIERYVMENDYYNFLLIDVDMERYRVLHHLVKPSDRGLSQANIEEGLRIAHTYFKEISPL